MISECLMTGTRSCFKLKCFGLYSSSIHAEKGELALHRPEESLMSLLSSPGPVRSVNPKPGGGLFGKFASILSLLSLEPLMSPGRPTQKSMPTV